MNAKILQITLIVSAWHIPFVQLAQFNSKYPDPFSVVKHLKKLIFVFWGLSSLALIGWMGLGHSISFKPTATITSPSDKWTMTHVLAPDCRCSSIVLESLLSRKAEPDIYENILWMSQSKPPQIEQLKQNGFSLQLAQVNEDKKEIEGVPTLIVTNQKGNDLYVGGYSYSKLNDVKQIKATEILNSLRGRGTLNEYPVFGCATSLKYRKFLNPFAQK